MRGVYTASHLITGCNSARTLLYITAPSSQVVEILEASVTNADTETNEQLRCTWQDISTLGTPTATTLTPAKHEAGGVERGGVNSESQCHRQ